MYSHYINRIRDIFVCSLEQNYFKEYAAVSHYLLRELPLHQEGRFYCRKVIGEQHLPALVLFLYKSRFAGAGVCVQITQTNPHEGTSFMLLEPATITLFGEPTEPDSLPILFDTTEAHYRIRSFKPALIADLFGYLDRNIILYQAVNQQFKGLTEPIDEYTSKNVSGCTKRYEVICSYDKEALHETLLAQTTDVLRFASDYFALKKPFSFRMPQIVFSHNNVRYSFGEHAKYAAMRETKRYLMLFEQIESQFNRDEIFLRLRVFMEKMLTSYHDPQVCTDMERIKQTIERLLKVRGSDVDERINNLCIRCFALLDKRKNLKITENELGTYDPRTNRITLYLCAICNRSRRAGILFLQAVQAVYASCIIQAVLFFSISDEQGEKSALQYWAKRLETETSSPAQDVVSVITALSEFFQYLWCLSKEEPETLLVCEKRKEFLRKRYYAGWPYAKSLHLIDTYDSISMNSGRLLQNSKGSIISWQELWKKAKSDWKEAYRLLCSLA